MKVSKLTPFILFLTVALTSSCGMPLLSKRNDLVHKQGATTKMYSTTNESFENYISLFEEAAAQELSNPYYKIGDVPVNFGDTENEEFDGVCFSYPDGTKEVIIKKDFWDRANTIQRRVLVFHELGHCALGRTHDEDTVTHSGIVYKTSVMHPIIPDSMQYLKAEAEYKSELFTLDKAAIKQKIETL